MLTRIRSRAFTLLELIVVLVVLALLAALAIPTFSKVIERSQDQVTLTSLKAVARDAQALRAFEQTGWPANETAVRTAVQETSYAAGASTLAASAYSPVKTDEDPSNGEITYRYSATGLSLAMLSPSGHVCIVAATFTSLSPGTCVLALEGGDTASGVVETNDPAVMIPGVTAPVVTPPVVATPPAQVQGVTATAGNASAIVTFPEVSGATSYEVFSGTTKVASGTASPIGIPGLTNGVTYTFTVVAINAVGPGVASAASNPVTPSAPVEAPTAVTGVTATAGDRSAAVNFTAPSFDGGSPIVRYDVYNGNLVVGSGAGTSITVSGLTNGQTYQFTVRAVNAVYPGAQSALSNPVVPVGPPNAPTNVAASAANGGATVSFTIPTVTGGSPLVNYDILANGLVIANTASSPATLTNLVNGTSYSFMVRARNAAGLVSPNSLASGSITPAAPVMLESVSTGSSNATVLGGATAMASVTTSGSPAQTVELTSGQTIARVSYFIAPATTSFALEGTVEVYRGAPGAYNYALMSATPISKMVAAGAFADFDITPTAIQTSGTYTILLRSGPGANASVAMTTGYVGTRYVYGSSGYGPPDNSYDIRMKLWKTQ